MEWDDVFDIHSHIGTYRGKEYPLSDALGRMDRNGISRAVVCPFVTGLLDRDDFRRANDYIIAAVKDCPERLVGMCALTPAHGPFAVEDTKMASGWSAVCEVSRRTLGASCTMDGMRPHRS